MRWETMRNQTVDQKVSSAGFKRFWELRQVVGKNADGSFRTQEAFIDMLSGQGGNEKDVYLPDEHGWNASLPDLPSGDPGKQPIWQPPSQVYRRNYDRIRWDK